MPDIKFIVEAIIGWAAVAAIVISATFLFDWIIA